MEPKDPSTGKFTQFGHSNVDPVLGLSAHLVGMFCWALQSMIFNGRIILFGHPDTAELSHNEFELR
jgi:hypothetical protein